VNSLRILSIDAPKNKNENEYSRGFKRNTKKFKENNSEKQFAVDRRKTLWYKE
jgi:hypothetical protein